ncbi:hypothetical protein [Granulicella tundricola]|nr:hypothetical protein [Granulicella tundricola]
METHVPEAGRGAPSVRVMMAVGVGMGRAWAWERGAGGLGGFSEGV